jgi:DNA-binding NarL/FixJ family response regulator
MLTTPVIDVLVIDDHPVVGEGVALLVRRDPGIRVIGSVRTVHEARLLLRQTPADIVLLDLRLPGIMAPEAVDLLRSEDPDTKIVIFTAFIGHPALSAALVRRVSGCLFKDAARHDLAAAIRQVAAGRRVFDPRTGLAPVGPPEPEPGLTRREYDVLRCAAMGKTNAEISELVALSPNTVKTYLQVVYRKLAARNRVEAIARAAEAGLL